MESIVVAFLVLVLIILVLLIPGTAARQATIEHEQTLAAMQDASDEAKARITQLHRAYRRELARAARNRAAQQRRTR
jgi:hypothetical protein